MWVSSGDGLAYTSLLYSYFHSFDSIFFSLNADVPSFKASNTDVFWELFSQRTKIVRLFNSEHIYENTKELFGNRPEKKKNKRNQGQKQRKSACCSFSPVEGVDTLCIYFLGGLHQPPRNSIPGRQSGF